MTKRVPLLGLLLLGVALLAIVGLPRLLSTGAPSPISQRPRRGVQCSILGQTNDAAGTTQVLFLLTNSYERSVLVGLDGIEVMDTSGWHKVRDEQQRELVGVAPHSTKTFAFPVWSQRIPWRLRLIYNPPSSLTRAIYQDVEVHLKGISADEVIMLTTPPIN